jgi:4-oxalmesaconate hydratase
MKKLWYDTCNYSEEGLDFLFKVIGPERCLFGTERPGTGSAPNPDWGRDYDDIKPVIENIGWLSASDRKKIFEDNARVLYHRAFQAKR